MISVAFMVLMQLSQPETSFLVSTKAGLVNYVQGAATVKAATSVPAGQPITTGPGGAVELLLNPGSYLRMGESTSVVLDRIELSDIAVRILHGSAVIEASGVDKDLPLTVGVGKLKMEIIKSGIYLIADGRVVVVEGKIRDANNGLVYGKGYQISDDQGYRANKVKTFTTQLELWSQKRSAQIALANVNVANSLRQRRNLPLSSFLDVWLWSSVYGSFIYMPGGRYRSPYGYNYRSVGEVYTAGGGGSRNNSSGGGGYNSGGGSSSNASSAGGGGGAVSYSSGIQSSGGGTSNPSPTPSAGAQAGTPVSHGASVAP